MIDNVEGKVMITTDHGEILGGRICPFHPVSMSIQVSAPRNYVLYPGIWSYLRVDEM